MKIKTQDRVRNTSSRNRSGNSKKRGLNKKKPDNTKLFIGLGVGAFFLIFLIIAAASGSGQRNTNKSQVAEKKSTYSLPLADRKEIYNEYSTIDDKLEDNAAAKISALQGEELRLKGKGVRSEKKRLLQNAKVDLIRKFKKKYPGFTSSYMNKIVDEGIDKSW